MHDKFHTLIADWWEEGGLYAFGSWLLLTLYLLIFAFIIAGTIVMLVALLVFDPLMGVLLTWAVVFGFVAFMYLTG